MITTGHLRAFEMGIDTHEELVVYMRRDCDVCKAEGFAANARLQIQAGDKTLIATLNTVTLSALPAGTIGFSVSAWRRLKLTADQPINVRHAPVVQSLSALRKKIYGNHLGASEIASIINDINRGHYSDIHIASFVTSCAGGNLDTDETVALTQAMISAGSRLSWPGYSRIYDKHCVGGLPGNRTTPIVIAIASAAGLIIPKTSSRAITSPSGTADTMEILTNVDLSLTQLQTVVRQTGACLAWGGRIKLSPTDDVLIRIERALDLDGEGQLVASVLSKKIAAGSTHILIDIPVGPTAKVRDHAQAERLSQLFYAVARSFEVHLRCVVTDGSQTIGNGIGPGEEARDVIAVLQNQLDAPSDLIQRSLLLAANLLSMASGDELDVTIEQAKDILFSGKAWAQFRRICDAQGGLKAIPDSAYHTTLTAAKNGRLIATDNRRLAQLAKLAGAPSSPIAGVRLRVKAGQPVSKGQYLATLFAATSGELAYALDYYEHNRDLFQIENAV
ncbi:thymidine phosphorylase family protein [Cellvibrio sp. PSBB006]|uniref:thymidine phosphorylase family protein n=1 Tax=Cellvibrio sp. PSBB006 TaxID=1987723 RepID=UPI000B3B42FB|nr:thymidine phosphorylase family protein [Cellvibrio sp. PSBB006]ARU26680.1 thymidine phosphorylase [Cellvibrio sp. PSBB006]